MKRASLLLAIGVPVVLASWMAFNHSASYRFRMTVQAETPQGPKSASAVYEVYAAKSLFRLLPEEASGGLLTRGQAIELDLPKGPVFVLMNTPSDSDGLGSLVTKTFRPNAAGGGDNFLTAVRSIRNHFWGNLAQELPSEVRDPYGKNMRNWPLVVRFSNIDDPTSIVEVDPKSINLKKIVVETTRDPVSSGISKRLPWITSRVIFYPADPKLGVSVPLGSLTEAQRLSVHDFSSEFGK